MKDERGRLKREREFYRRGELRRRKAKAAPANQSPTAKRPPGDSEMTAGESN
jgi:hypothetical protein